ncbi:MAG: hypothetical protein EZS28_032006, partial [Streblomastix strix]
TQKKGKTQQIEQEGVKRRRINDDDEDDSDVKIMDSTQAEIEIDINKLPEEKQKILANAKSDEERKLIVEGWTKDLRNEIQKKSRKIRQDNQEIKHHDRSDK